MRRRHYLVDQVDNLAGQLRAQVGVAGDISARLGEALDQPGSDQVSTGRADDWDLARRLLGGSCGRRKPGHDHIDFEPHQFRRQFGKATNLSLVRSELEPNVLPLDVTELAQRLGKQPPESLPT